jgi:DNA-binding response OmpR family regulator
MQSTSLAGRSILIVEDEPLIALEISIAFRQVGAIAVMARSLAEAVRHVQDESLSAAVLDFGLGHEDTAAVCSRLQERAIPFVLHSGYTHTPDACRGGTVVPKPADPAVLVKTIVALLPRYGRGKEAHAQGLQRDLQRNV